MLCWWQWHARCWERLSGSYNPINCSIGICRRLLSLLLLLLLLLDTRSGLGGPTVLGIRVLHLSDSSLLCLRCLSRGCCICVLSVGYLTAINTMAVLLLLRLLRLALFPPAKAIPAGSCRVSAYPHLHTLVTQRSKTHTQGRRDSSNLSENHTLCGLLTHVQHSSVD